MNNHKRNITEKQKITFHFPTQVEYLLHRLSRLLAITRISERKYA